MVASIEEVSSSLVREYLSRKGLRRTIACMDEEHPRTEASINNRSDLRQILHVEDLYRNNKVHKNPVKTLLEIIVKHHMEGHRNDKITFNKDPLQSTSTSNFTTASNSVRTPIEMNDTKTEDGTRGFIDSKVTKLRSFTEEARPSQGTLSLPETDSQTGFWTDSSVSPTGRPQMVSLQENESFTRREPERKTVTESTQKNRTTRIRRGMMAGPIASSPQELNKKRQTRRLGAPHTLFGNEEDNRTESVTNRNVDDLHVSEMILDDIDDDEEFQELSKVSFQTSILKQSYASRPLDLHTATALKEVLLGSSSSCFNVEWRNQGFTFSETHDLRYGIVQKKGGPCGVLASIQACVLKKLLFEGIDSSNIGLQRLRPSNTTRRKCLILAVAEVLWRAGEEKRAIVAIPSGRNHFIPTGHYKTEGVLEKMTCFTVDNLKDLKLLLEQHIQQFESAALGCILLTISAVLSRSIEQVREDMDVPTTTLIGAHGYCTQELVNLLLCGRAVSNVFDNDMELDSGNGNLTLLKGIKCRSDIGLLSLFEHYNICKVGANLQTPRFPIWVVCSESHFSVLFGLQRELLTNQDRAQEFDLYYYDGLANQQEEIRLTLSVGTSALPSQDVDPDLIPPLEHCIRTKWRDAVVSWNDTEPIL
ncbi:putative ubiquitin carboxyl-terminal hydrolase MINDY-4 [Diretmus argenteus]